MTTVTEAVTAKPSLGADLAAGLTVLSGAQSVTFQLYKKMVLPLDGFVFWINYSLVTPTEGDPPETTTIQGALHYSTDLDQDESATTSTNMIVFSAYTQCDLFQQIDPQFLYLADYNGIRFSFSSQGKYFQQADLWHYMGVAVTSKINTQIIDTQAQLNSLKLIVSNSLPIWLAMPTYVPPYPGFTCPISKMYPSFLVPENEPPPYASVHIEDTTSLAETSLLGPTLTSTQLTSETVRVTMYGVNNDDAITFKDFVSQYSYDWNFIGMMNMPIIRDEKLTAPEIQVIAQKKSIEFKVSYLQNSVRNVARQHILKAKVQYPGVTIPKNTYIVIPSVIDPVLIGFKPIIVQETNIYTVPTNSIILSSIKPIVLVPRTLTVDTSSISITLTTPNAVTTQDILLDTPSSAALRFTETQPTVLRTYIISPISTSNTLITTTPIVDWTNVIRPASVTISLLGSSPISVVETNRAPNTNISTLTTTIPNVVAVTSQSLVPNTNNAILSGIAPITSFSNIFSLVPIKANLSIISTTPSVNRTNNVQTSPATKLSTITRTTPIISWTNSVWTVPVVKSLSLATTTSSIVQTTNASPVPNTNPFTLSGTQPVITIFSSVSVSPDSASLSFVEMAPGLGTVVPYQLDMITPIVGGFN